MCKKKVAKSRSSEVAHATLYESVQDLCTGYSERRGTREEREKKKEKENKFVYIMLRILVS